MFANRDSFPALALRTELKTLISCANIAGSVLQNISNSSKMSPYLWAVVMNPERTEVTVKKS